MCFIRSFAGVAPCDTVSQSGHGTDVKRKAALQKARMPSLWRYAEDCEEPISRNIGLMVLVGQNNCQKRCLLTAISTLRHMFS